MSQVFNEVVQLEKSGDTSIIRIRRPQKRNSLTAATVEALLDAFDAAENRGTSQIVFLGEGKSFCAGFDFSNMENETDASLSYRFIRVETLLQKVALSSVPTVGMAQGPTFGAGADLLVACDTRIVSPDCTLRFPGLQFDLILGTHRLAARVGIDYARSILQESRRVSAPEAIEANLATRLVAEDAWQEQIQELESDAQSLGSHAQASMKAILHVGDPNQDMAALVRSATTPGLSDRISAYLGKATT